MTSTQIEKETRAQVPDLNSAQIARLGFLRDHGPSPARPLYVALRKEHPGSASAGLDDLRTAGLVEQVRGSSYDSSLPHQLTEEGRKYLGIPTHLERLKTMIEGDPQFKKVADQDYSRLMRTLAAGLQDGPDLEAQLKQRTRSFYKSALPREKFNFEAAATSPEQEPPLVAPSLGEHLRALTKMSADLSTAVENSARQARDAQNYYSAVNRSAISARHLNRDALTQQDWVDLSARHANASNAAMETRSRELNVSKLSSILATPEAQRLLSPELCSSGAQSAEVMGLQSLVIRLVQLNLNAHRS